jgi:hypothetical protein
MQLRVVKRKRKKRILAIPDLSRRAPKLSGASLQGALAKAADGKSVTREGK